MIVRTIIIFILIFLIGCAGRHRDERLVRVADIVSEQPEAALASLDSINYGSLSEADRQYYDLLQIKAQDKAYIIHTTDSLILKVVEYYASHDKYNLYAESLYYAGRVYSDLGDSPSALQYFQEALEHIGENNQDIDLRAAILSQTGRLLNNLRFYDEAVPYTEESIRIDKMQKDTVNWVYDLQLLGGTYLRAEQYDRAEQYFNQAISLSYNLPESFEAKSRMYLAELKYQTGKLDSALILIRHTPDAVSRLARNSALAYASRIYLDNGITDTAYIYARELIDSPDSIDKRIGYETLMSPALRDYVPADSLYRYIPDFITQFETRYNDNEIELSAIQQGYYNYSRHLAEKHNVETKNMKLRIWLLAISLVCLILITSLLFYKSRTRKILIDLHNAQVALDILKEQIAPTTGSASTSDKEKEIRTESISLLNTDNVGTLREHLRNELQNLCDRGETIVMNGVIDKSEAYKKLRDLIEQKHNLPTDDNLWGELEAAVLSSSPKFKENLMVLTHGKLTTVDLHTALLIKCHVTPMEMCRLLNRSKGAIVSRRDNLCRKIFGERMGTTFIDGIIRLL